MNKDEQEDMNAFADAIGRAILESQRTNYPPSFEELCRRNEEYEKERKKNE